MRVNLFIDGKRITGEKEELNPRDIQLIWRMARQMNARPSWDYASNDLHISTPTFFDWLLDWFKRLLGSKKEAEAHAAPSPPPAVFAENWGEKVEPEGPEVDSSGQSEQEAEQLGERAASLSASSSDREAVGGGRGEDGDEQYAAGADSPADEGVAVPASAAGKSSIRPRGSEPSPESVARHIPYQKREKGESESVRVEVKQTHINRDQGSSRANFPSSREFLSRYYPPGIQNPPRKKDKSR